MPDDDKRESGGKTPRGTPSDRSPDRPVYEKSADPMPGSKRYWDKEIGEWRFIDIETGKSYTTPNAVVGAQAARRRRGKRISKPRRAERAGTKSFGPKVARREGADGIQGYVIPKTTDAVLEYLRRNVESFGVGTLSEYDRRILRRVESYGDTERDRKARHELAIEYVDEMRKDVVRLLAVVYGEHWRVLIRSTGMSDDLIAYLSNYEYKPTAPPRDLKRLLIRSRKRQHIRNRAVPPKMPWPVSEAIMHLRHVVLMALIHIKDIMDSTREIEREFWVLLQQMHDLRVFPDGREARDRITSSMMAADVMNKLKMPMNETTLMPLRARALLHYPEMGLSHALKSEGEKLHPDYSSQRSELYTVGDIDAACTELISVSEEISRFKDRVRSGQFDLDRERLEREWAELSGLLDEKCTELEAKQGRLYKDLVERSAAKVRVDADDAVRDRVIRLATVEERTKNRIKKDSKPSSQPRVRAKRAEKESAALRSWKARYAYDDGDSEGED